MAENLDQSKVDSLRAQAKALYSTPGGTELAKEVEPGAPDPEKEKVNKLRQEAKALAAGSSTNFEPALTLAPRSKYDKGQVLGTDWEQHYAQRQGKLAEAGNATAQTVLNFIPGLVGSVAAIADVEDWTAGIYNFDNEVGNAFTRMGQAAKDATAEAFPIYQQEAGKTMNLGSSEWWFKNGSSVVGSAAEFAVLGWGVGSLLSKGLTASKWLSAVDAATGTARLNAAGQAVAVPANAFMLNHAESILDATQTYDRYLKEAQSAGKSEDEARLIASQAAAHNVNLNRVNILLNLTSVGALMKGARGVRNIVKPQSLLGRVALEGGQEYLEETVNFYAQNRASELGNSLIDGSKYTGPTLDKLLADMKSDEGIEAGFLGLVGGVFQTGFTGAVNRMKGNNEAEQRFIEQQTTQQQAFEKFNKDNNLANVETLVTNGNLQLNLINRRNEIQKEIEDDIANNKGVSTEKAIEFKKLNRAILVNQAYQNFQLGTTEYLEKTYQDIAALSPEEAAKNGFKGEELNPKSEMFYKTKAEDYLKDLAVLEQNYIKTNNFINGRELFNLKALELDQTRDLETFAAELAVQEQAAQDALNKLTRSKRLDGFSGSLNLTELLTKPKYYTEVGNVNDPEQIKQRKGLITKAKKLEAVQGYQKLQELTENLEKEIEHTQDQYKKASSSEVQSRLLENRRAEIKSAEEELEKEELNLAKAEQAAKAKTEKAGEITAPIKAATPAFQNLDVDPQTTAELEIVEELALKVLDHPTEVVDPLEIITDDISRSLVLKHKTFFDEIINRSREFRAAQASQHKDAMAGDPSNTTATDVKDIEGEQKKLSVVDITTLTNPEATQDEKKGKVKPKLHRAFNVLAYLSRTYTGTVDKVDADNILNTLQDPRILDNTFIDVGDEVILEVDSNASVEDETGAKVPWRELINTEAYKASPQLVVENAPITVKRNGSVIAYLHRPDWITADKIDVSKKSVMQDKQDLINLRSAVLQSTKPLSTKITVRTPGKLFIDYTKAPSPVSENLADPTLEFAVYYRNNNLTTARTGEVDTKVNGYNILNRDTLKNGTSYAIIPVKKARKINGIKTKAQYWAVPLLPNKLTEEVVNSLTKAAEIFYATLENKDLTEDQKSIVEQIQELNKNSESSFDITTPVGLRNYYNLFIYSHNKDINNKNQSLDNYLKTTDLTSDYYAHEVGDKGIFFGRGKMGTISKGDTEAFMEGLKAHLRERYFHTSLDFLKSNIKVPLIDANNKVSSYNNTANYIDHLKTNVWQTNVMGQNISKDSEKPNYVYTIQPIIEIAPVALPKQQIIDTTTGETITTNNPLDILFKARLGIVNEEGGIIPGALTINPESEEDITIEDEETSDLPAELSPEQVKQFKNKFKVPGLSSTKQRSLINFITGQVNEAFNKDSQVSFAKVMADIKAEFERLAPTSKLAEVTIKHWPRVFGLTNYYLRANFKYEATEDVFIETENGVESLTEEEAATLENWMMNSLTRDPVTGLSDSFRRFLGLIENPDRKSAVMGFEKYNPVEIYRKLSSLLADTYPNYEVMKDKLMALQDQYNFIAPVIQRLDKADLQTKTEFVVAMSKHYVSMEHVYIVPRYRDAVLSGYDTYIRSDNSSTKSVVTRDTWLNNLFYTDLVKPTAKGEYVFDKKTATKLLEEFKTVNKDTVTEFDISNWVARMGIYLDPKTILDIKEKGFTSLNPRTALKTYLSLFTADTGPFKLLAKHLETISKSDKPLVVENSSFAKDSSLFNLAKLDSQFNDMTHSNVHKSGKLYISSYADNKYLTDRVKELKNNIELLTGLADRSFSKSSWWLKQMLETEQAPDGSLVYSRDAEGNVIIDESNDFHRQFGYNYLSLEVLKQKGKQARKKQPLEDLSPLDHEKTKFLFFQRGGQGTEKGLRVGEFFMMTLSNKNTMLAMKTPVPPVSIKEDGTVSDQTVDFLYENTVLPEIQRMREYNDSHNVSNYTEGSKLFYFYPKLNELDLFNEGPNGETSLKLDADQGESLKAIKDVIKDTINEEIKHKITEWTDFKFIVPTSNGVVLNYFDKTYAKFVRSQLPANQRNNIQVANFAAAEMVTAYMIHNVNLFQTITTDPATQWKSKAESKIQQVYDTFDNIGKRLGGEISPGRDLARDNENETYRLAVIQDVKLPSKALAAYAELDPELAKAYKNINSTDAVEFITLAEKINFMRQSGKLTDAQLKTLDDIDLDKPLNLKQLGLVLQVDKPIAVGTRVDGNIESKIYVKSAAFTLIPDFIKGTELEKLNDLMVKKNIDRLAFASAVKLGSPKNIKSVFDSDGNFNENVDLELGVDIFQIGRKYLRLQQETPVKKNTKISRVSQASKLLFVDILNKSGFKLPSSDKSFTAEELKDLYNDYYNQIYQGSYNELLAELEIDPTQKVWEPNPEKLNKILQDELVKRGYPPHDLEALSIQVVDGQARFKLPLWALAKSGKLESFINSIINNRIIKQKFNGYSYVLASEAGFKFTKEDNKKQVYTDLADLPADIQNKIVFTKSFKGELKPALENNYLNQVIIPWKYKDNLSDYTNADGSLNTDKLDPELLKMFGMRTPNQGPNSTGALEVVGFLPPEAGDLIIAPLDFVTQMGSDFDIDKLYVYMYNYSKNKSGKLTKINEKTDTNQRQYLENKIYDIHMSINTNPDPDIQKSILRPVGTEELKTISDKLKDIDSRFDSNQLSPVSGSYQSQKYLNSAFANEAIGVFAVGNTFNAMTQYVPDLKLINRVDDAGKVIYSRIQFGGEVFDGEKDFSDPKTLSGREFKSANISKLLSAAVDDEKEQIINSIGINTHTIGVYYLLTKAGFKLDTISYFLKQPAIQEYTRLITVHNNVESKAAAELDRKMFKDLPQIFKDQGFLDGEIHYNVKDKFNDLYKMSSTQMLSMLENRDTAPDYLEGQYALLEKFKSLKGNEATTIRTVNSAINLDNKGTGKNLFESIARQSQIEDLRTEVKLENAEKLIGDYVSKTAPTTTPEEVIRLKAEGYIETSHYYIKPTSIPGYAALYGVVANNNLWEKYFPYNKSSVLTVFKEVNSNMEKQAGSFLQESERNKNLFYHIKNYIFTDNEIITEPVKSTRKELLFDYPVLNETTGKTEAHLSLASIYNQLLTTPETRKIINDHKFLRNLFTGAVRSTEEAKTILYRNPTTDEATSFEIYSDVLDSFQKPIKLGTFNNVEYTTKTFIEHLAAATMLSATSGLQNDLLQYIPVDYYVANGIATNLHNYKFTKLLQDKVTLDGVSRVTEQYFQHFPGLTPLLEGAWNDIATNVIPDQRIEYTEVGDNKLQEVVIDGTATFVLNDTERLYKYYHRPHFSGKTELFRLVDKELRTYAKISTLGGLNNHEYNANVEIASSNVEANNPESQPTLIRRSIEERPKSTQIKPSDNITTEGETALSKYGLRVEYYTLTPAEVSSTLSSIQTLSNQPHYRTVAKFLQDRIQDFKLEVKSADLLDPVTELPKRGDATIVKDKVVVRLNLPAMRSAEDIELTVLHELLHAVTIQTIANPANDRQRRALRNLTELFEQFKNTFYQGEDFKSLQKKFQGTPGYISRVYPAKNIREFVVAVLTQPEFQQMLQQLPYNEKQTFWDKFKEFLNLILKSFGLDINSTAAKAVNDVLLLTERSNNEKILNNKLSKPGTTNEGILDIDPGLPPVNFQAADPALEKLLHDRLNKNQETSDLPFDTSDFGQQDKPSSKFPKLIQEKKSHMYQLYQRIKQLNLEIGKATDAAEKKALLKRRTKAQSKLEGVKNELSQAQVTVKLEDLVPIAQAELAEVTTLLARQSNLDFKDLNIIDKKVKLWKNYRENFLTQEERASPQITEDFTEILSAATRLSDELEEVKKAKMLDMATKLTGKKFDSKAFFNAIKDMSGMASYTLDISNADHTLVQVLFEQMKQTEVYSNQEMIGVTKDLQQLFEKVKGKESITGKNFSNFFETDENGDITGGLVMPYSQEYLDTKYSLLRTAKAFEAEGDKTKARLAWKSFNKFIKENELVFDIRKLTELPGFEKEFTADKGKLEEQLKSIVGEAEYNRKLQRALVHYERFKADRQIAQEEVEQSFADEQDRVRAMDAWDSLNDIFKYFDYRQDDKNTVSNRGWVYSEYTPKAVDDKGKPTKWYSEKYKTIQQDADVQKLHDYVVNLMVKLRRYMPENKARDFYINSLPALQKSIFESLKTEGMGAAMTSFWDNTKQAMTSADIGQLLFNNTPDGRTLTVNLDTISSKIDRAFEQRVKDFKRVNDVAPDEATLKQLKADAVKEVESGTSLDFPAIIGAYTAALVTYHHKAKIEDSVRLAEEVFKNHIKEVKTNAAGQPVERDIDGTREIVTVEGGLKNYSEMIKYTLDRFYHVPKEIEGKTEEKVYSKKDKLRKKELERELAKYTPQLEAVQKDLEKLKDNSEGMVEGEYLVQKERLDTELATIQDKIANVNEELNKLGGAVTGSGVWDMMLKYIVIKGLGWNPFSGITNMSFGLVSNITEAAAGRYFNEAQMSKAYRLSLHSVGKFASFNQVQSDTAIKIRTLMDDLGVLKKNSEELFKDNLKLTGAAKSLHWAHIQNRTEYLNQAPVMISMMLNKPIKRKDGTVSNLWEAYGKQGKWDTENFGEQSQQFPMSELAKFISSVDKVIRKTHGNYDPMAQIRLKGTALGRSLSVFRSWMFEGFANRFEGVSTDDILGHDRKGRYRSYSGGSLALVGAGVGSLLFPGLGTAIGAGIGAGIGAKFKGKDRFLPEYENMSQFEELAWVSKYLIRKLSFGIAYKNVSLEERFTTIDAMNLRKNMTELSILAYTMGIVMLLKFLVEGTDDDDEKSFLTYSLNVMNRIQQDIGFYADPISFKQVMKDPVPATGVITDMETWMHSVMKYTQGEDEIPTGRFAGQSRLQRSSSKLIPGFKQLKTTVDLATQEY